MDDQVIMSAGGVIDFLVELPEGEASVILQTASSQKSPFVFKLAESPTPFQTSIESFFEGKVILDKDVGHLQFDLEQDVSIKFNVGTEVFFVKTKLKRHLNRICFERAAKIVQLKRRKEPRFVVPKKWAQTASLGGVPCVVQDISLSGIRFECADPKLVLKTQDAVKVQFQIYKRAELSADAIVRFFMARPNNSSLIGMEFQNVSENHKDKVKAIIEDIQNFQATIKY